jgi:molybdopterin-binding protein
MRFSARNVLKGKVKKVRVGPVSAEVTLEIAPGIEVVAVISATSAKDLKLKKVKSAYAVIKASSVMVGVD